MLSLKMNWGFQSNSVCVLLRPARVRDYAWRSTLKEKETEDVMEGGWYRTKREREVRIKEKRSGWSRLGTSAFILNVSFLEGNEHAK
jgi:hypothetical protein